MDLNLLRFKESLRIEHRDRQLHIWDPIRRKWIRSGPEELVRQLLIQYLIKEVHYPERLIQVEKVLTVHKRRRRFDILLFDRTLDPFVLIECKRPEIAINQHTFDQISRYNIALQVPYLVVSNGKETHCCQIDYDLKSYHFIDTLPTLNNLS